MRIENHLSRERFMQYAAFQRKQLSSAVDALEPEWEHASVVREILNETQAELEKLVSTGELPLDSTSMAIHERKVEKCATWIEVMRLAAFQYGRYCNEHRSVTEGLYSTLLALAAQHCQGLDGKTIAVLGCGPGRTVLDFAIAFPHSTVIGLDYSLLSLVVAKHVLGIHALPLQIPVRNLAGDSYSKLLTIPNFSSPNSRLGLCDLTERQRIRADLIICSNTINLLPDHEQALMNISEMLTTGGVIIFADLTGWRLDRHPEQMLLRNSTAIKTSFAKYNIGDTVLAVGFDLIPVKVNDVAGIWGVTAVLPLIAGPKPALARYASSGFGNNACVDIPALIGTPGNKARTPLYTGIKTHVRPIGVA